eukprot:3368331-Pyramimonas_sp.AAC.1
MKSTLYTALLVLLVVCVAGARADAQGDDARDARADAEQVLAADVADLYMAAPRRQLQTLHHNPHHQLRHHHMSLLCYMVRGLQHDSWEPELVVTLVILWYVRAGTLRCVCCGGPACACACGAAFRHAAQPQQWHW